jgi:Flp pilus assembly protein TadG
MWGFMPLHNISPARRRRQRGSAMLEGGLTLVVFVSLFLGAIDLAQILLVHQALGERVRFAARSTAVNCCNSDTVKNLVLYASTTAPASGTGYYGLTTNNVAVTFADQNTPDQRVTIRVSGYSYKSFTPMLAGISGNGIPIQVTIPLEQP